MFKKLTILGLTTLKVKTSRHMNEVKISVERALLKAINAKPATEDNFYRLFTRDLFKECLDDLTLVEIYCISVIACKIAMKFNSSEYAGTQLTKVPDFLYIHRSFTNVAFDEKIFGLLVDIYVLALQGQALLDDSAVLKTKTKEIQDNLKGMSRDAELIKQEVDLMLNENKE